MYGNSPDLLYLYMIRTKQFVDSTLSSGALSIVKPSIHRSTRKETPNNHFKMAPRSLASNVTPVIMLHYMVKSFTAIIMVTNC